MLTASPIQQEMFDVTAALETRPSAAAQLPTSYRAVRIHKQAGQLTIGLEQLPLPSQCAADQVLLRVHYSSINFKDIMSCQGNPAVTRRFPHTPGIDAAGVVVQSSDPRYPVGTEVLVCCRAMGMQHPGGFAEYVQVPSHWLEPKPPGFSLRDCMVLGTAGFTAALAVDAWVQHQQRHAADLAAIDWSRQHVAVTGVTGGVGLLAALMLRQLGVQVTALVGSATLAQLQQPSAGSAPASSAQANSGQASTAALCTAPAQTTPAQTTQTQTAATYQEPQRTQAPLFPQTAKVLHALGVQHWQDRDALCAASLQNLAPSCYDGVIDVAGGPLLAALIKQLQPHGIALATGMVADTALPLNVLPFILRGVTLQGINAESTSEAERAALWQRLRQRYLPADLTPFYQKVTLAQLPALLTDLQQGHPRAAGRVLVDCQSAAGASDV